MFVAQTLLAFCVAVVASGLMVLVLDRERGSNGRWVFASVLFMTAMFWILLGVVAAFLAALFSQLKEGCRMLFATDQPMLPCSAELRQYLLSTEST